VRRALAAILVLGLLVRAGLLSAACVLARYEREAPR
jgi:hypothetical protein